MASSSGFIIFMPWLTIPAQMRVGRFRFSPIRLADVGAIIDPSMVSTVQNALRCYVQKNGHPIQSCTILLRVSDREPWNIPRSHWDYASEAAKTLAIACLSEQRFLEGHFSPHLNATMFHIIGQGVSVGSDQIAPFFARRGGGLQIGGMRFKDIVFQRPPQIEGTDCSLINAALIKSIGKARRLKLPVADAIDSSLELFLLGHSETPELDWDRCVMLSAMAFERLLTPTQSSAQAMAATFASHWSPFVSVKISDAKRVKPDAKYATEQADWPLHRKWIKELYEARSATAHRGVQIAFSRNWLAWQHLIVAAFAYPLTIKLMLSENNLYTLSDHELGACDALDDLLDSSWGKGWRKPPEWSEILSKSEAYRAIRAIIDRAIVKSPSGQRRKIKK
ncbi:hypothetical protein [Bradyrhizobium sp. cf659]|uniref:hypothetical protein n=1 Tax=Bradyrhizobium sp. cf659 TaxID=1761771 RepID=UPI0008E1687C|nr:hypothetical protein [Bradyrhizobium sp. cf659]SFJ94452.1 hypothetical protein SAMN04487925_113174 [Bradyrhizobium sp. cf659]